MGESINFVRAQGSSRKPQPLDEAWKYLEVHHDVVDGTSTLGPIRRRIDWRLVPMFWLCSLVSSIDKHALNYAAVMGLREDLGLKGNDFTNVATIFFAVYMVAEIPNVYCLQKVPAAKWLGTNTLLFGVATASVAATHNFSSLLVVRVFVAIFEATALPSMALIASHWYTKREQALRFAVGSTGTGASQILGALLSFGFLRANDAHLAGWRIMFLTLGALTILVGLGVMLILPDTPMKARFLSNAEKTSLLRHISTNRTGIKNRTFRPEEIWEAVRDVQVWCFILGTVCLSCSSGVITSYSSTLIREIGYTPAQAGLLNAPAGVVAIIAMLITGFGVRHTSNRWAWIAGCAIPGILGGGLMSFFPHAMKAGLLVGVWLVSAITATLPLIYSWVAANVAGHTKRAFATAAVAAAFSVGNIIGPQTFQAKDAPEYRPAKIAVLVTQAGLAVVACMLALYYRRENGRRNAAGTRASMGIHDLDPNTEAWAGLTDKKDCNFRYVY